MGLWLYVAVTRGRREETVEVGAKEVLPPADCCAVFYWLAKHHLVARAPYRRLMFLYLAHSDGERAGLFMLHS